MPNIAGYELDERVVRQTPLATSYVAHKGDVLLLIKVFSYRADSDVTAQQHQALQERIREVVDGIGDISVPTVDCGVLAGYFAADSDVHDDARFSAKPLMTSASGDKIPDLADHIAEERRAVARMLEDPERTAEPEQRLIAWVLLAQMVASLVRRCHESDLVHQDLKPEQFLAVPIAGGVRPVIADFDWSFFGAEGPLKRVSTLRYSSPEQVTRGLVGRPTDVFTLAIIVFEILTGGVWPLATKAEMDDFISPKDIEAMSLRGGAQRTLREVYQEYFRTGALDFRAIDELDAVLAASLSPDAARRPTAAEIERTLTGKRLFVRDGGPPSAAPTWFRLQAVAAPSQSWTIRAGAGPENLRLDRQTCKRVFDELADADGNALHKYLPKVHEGDPAMPFVEFKLDASGEWFVRGVAGTKNTCRLRRKTGGEVELGSRWERIVVGDHLAVFSVARKEVLDGCQLEVVGPR